MTNEELVASIQAGERDRLPELWDQVERFVASRAQRLLTLLGGIGGVEFNDLYNSGYIALVSAVESFDPSEGRSFIGWLALHLKTAFAEAGGYRSHKQSQDPLHHALSFDAPLGTDKDSRTLGDTIEDPAMGGVPDVEERLWHEQLHAAIERALDELPEDERAVIHARYYEERTWQEIGPKARALGERALIRLRRPQISRELMAYIEERTPYYLRVGVDSFQSSNESAVERIVFIRERLERRAAR